jgi:hypothetical protein
MRKIKALKWEGVNESEEGICFAKEIDLFSFLIYFYPMIVGSRRCLQYNNNNNNNNNNKNNIRLLHLI